MKVGYDPLHFAKLFAVEDRHFWFRARNRLIASLARQAVAGLTSGYRVLEVGCGDGNVLRFLESACPDGTVVGMDYFHQGLRYARQRCLCPLVQGDVARPPFNTLFHLIGIFDVLEHLSDDVSALRDLCRILHPEGTLLVTVPAHASLWSDFDEASGHCRRYDRSELATKLSQAGFRVQRLTSYMAALYPLMWLRGVLDRTTGTHSIKKTVERDLRVVPVVNELLLFLLMQETHWISSGGSLPMGTSLVAIAHKS